ncbi:MAG: hypothetical protein N2C12_02130 [Planctomycetales bacterium]
MGKNASKEWRASHPDAFDASVAPIAGDDDSSKPAEDLAFAEDDPELIPENVPDAGSFVKSNASASASGVGIGFDRAIVDQSDSSAVDLTAPADVELADLRKTSAGSSLTLTRTGAFDQLLDEQEKQRQKQVTLAEKKEKGRYKRLVLPIAIGLGILVPLVLVLIMILSGS